METFWLVLVLYLVLFPGVIPQQYQWKCSSLDSQADQYYLPDVPEGNGFTAYLASLSNAWIDSSPGVTYIYGVNSSELNCTGIVTEVEYCYRTSSSYLNQDALVFTLSMLVQNGATFTVTNTIDIRSTPSGGLRGLCTSFFSRPYYCCDNASLAVEDQFQLPSQNFAYGITIPASSNVNFLGFRASNWPNLIVGQYQTPVVPVTGGVFTLNPSTNFVVDQAHRALRFALRPLQLMSYTPTSSIVSISSSSTSEHNTTSTPVASVTPSVTPTITGLSASTSASPSATLETINPHTTNILLQMNTASSPFGLISSPISDNIQQLTPSASSVDQIYTITEEIYESSEVLNIMPQSTSAGIVMLFETPTVMLTTFSQSSSVAVDTINFNSSSIVSSQMNTASNLTSLLSITRSESIQQTTFFATTLTLSAIGTPTILNSLMPTTTSDVMSSNLAISEISVSNMVSFTGLPDNADTSTIAPTRTSIGMSSTILNSSPLSNIISSTAITNEISSIVESSAMINTRSDAASYTSSIISTAIVEDGISPSIYPIMSSQTTNEGFIPSSSATEMTDFLSIIPNPSIFRSMFSTAISSINRDSSMPMSSPRNTKSTTSHLIVIEPSNTPTPGLDFITTFVERDGTTAGIEATISSAINTPIIGGAVGGVLALLLILLVVIVVAILIKRRLRFRGWKPNQNGDGGLSFNNAAFYDQNSDYNTISRNLEYDYAGIGPQATNYEVDEKRRGASLPRLPIENSYEYVDSTCIGGSKEKYYESIREASNEYATLRQEEPLYVAPATDESELYSQLEDLNTDIVTRTNVELGNILGSGQFGDVYRGTWQSSVGDVEVAVKTLKSDSKKDDKVKFLQEAAIMGQFKHPNVVTMHGVITDGEPILLVLEMLKKGDLRQYLLSMRQDDDPEVLHPDLDEHVLLSFCRQIASGMTYLSNKSFVHRDLAARNVLVSGDGMCKIADFGMSRDLLEENYYLSQGGGKIPVKWTAPEALHYKKYSTASDVWSFGVVMYEVWGVGHKPFEGLPNTQVLRMVESGFRLPPPPGCSRAIYKIMMACWALKVKQRPQFSNICIELSYPDSKLLYWSDEDKAVNAKVTKLGVGLEASDNLYRDLQVTFMSERRMESAYVDISTIQ